MSTLKLPKKITGFFHIKGREYRVVGTQDDLEEQITASFSAEVNIENDPEPTQFKIGECQGEKVFCFVKDGKGEMRALQCHEIEKINEVFEGAILS